MSIKFWTILIILLSISSIALAYWEITAVNSDTNSHTDSTVTNAASSTIVNLVTSTFSCPSCVANASLTNSSLTYVAGNGLTGGGAVSLGNSATINVTVDSTLSVSADSLGLNLNTGNIWTASTTFHTGNFGTLNATSSVYLGSLTLGTKLANAQLANSTISGVALGGTLNALTATNGTLTFSGSYTGAAAQNVGLNLNSGNTWTASTTFHTGNFGNLNATSSVYLGSLTLGTKLANAQLANSSIVINTALPLGGGVTANLGDTVSLTCTGCATFAFPWTVLSPTLVSTSTKISFTNGLASTSVLGSFNTGTLTATSGTSYLQAATIANGLTVTAGTVSFPATSIANAALQGSGGLTITPAGSLLASGCATVVLGGTCTLTGLAYNFTPTTNYGLSFSATTSNLYLKGKSLYASSTYIYGTVNPLFQVATSTLTPVLYVAATSTHPQLNADGGRVLIATSTQYPAGFLDELYVDGRANYSWPWYYTDFLGRVANVTIDTANVWDHLAFDTVGPDACTLSSLAAFPTGALRLNTAGTNANDVCHLDFKDTLQFNATATPVMETKVRLDVVTNVQLIAGFGNITNGQQGGTSTNPAEGVYFYFDPVQSANWQTVVHASSSTNILGGATSTTNIAVNAKQLYALRIEYNANFARFFIDGNIATTTQTFENGARIPTKNLEPEIYLKANTAAAKNLDIDYLKLWEQRP